MSDEDRKKAEEIVERWFAFNFAAKSPLVLSVATALTEARAEGKAEGRAEQREVDAKITESSQSWPTAGKNFAALIRRGGK